MGILGVFHNGSSALIFTYLANSLKGITIAEATIVTSKDARRSSHLMRKLLLESETRYV